jgi:hypothetical protein
MWVLDETRCGLCGSNVWDIVGAWWGICGGYVGYLSATWGLCGTVWGLCGDYVGALWG